MNHRSHVFLMFTLILSAALIASDESPIRDGAVTGVVPALDPANLDRSIPPGDDFFRFANGSYLASLEIPEDRSSYDAFDMLREDTARAVRELLEEVATDTSAKPGSITQKIRDFYNAGMDEESVEKQGIKPLQPLFGRIDALKTKNDLPSLLAQLHTTGITPLFGGAIFEDLMDSTRYRFYLMQAGLGLPDRDYYLQDDDRSQSIRERYVEHVQAMFQLMGDSEDAAARAAQVVMNLETRLASKSRTRTLLRNIPALYNKMSLDQLSQKAPEFDWKAYFASISQTEFGEVIVGMPEFFEEVSLVLKAQSLADLKTYLRWQVVTSLAPYLNHDFVDQNHKFFGEFLSGNTKIRARWERVVAATNGALGEPIGQLYVKKHFPAESKTRMLELVDNLKATLRSRLQNNPWMTDATRKAAIEKLDAMRVKIGYPDKWEDYSGLEIKTDAYVLNVIRANRFAFRHQLEKFGKPIDPDEWVFPPQTVNAGYSPLKNDITFPAGILQPPYFNPEADDAVNYGAIGVVIGHEMTHGFDDQGRHFDKNGNMVNWWTEEDEKAFNERTKLLIDQYGAFSALDGVHVNAELTLGENIADFGGLTIAHEAYQRSLKDRAKPQPIDGFSDDQRFFLSYAQLWRGKIRDEALRRQMVEDVHPWGEFRVNGALFNVPEFYQAFDIPEDARLYRTPKQRPVIW